MDAATILAMTCEQLKEQLRLVNLVTTGNKQFLQDRLLRHYQLSRPVDVEEQSDESEAPFELAEQIPLEQPRGEHCYNSCSARFTLKDVEDSLTTFCGTDSVNVKHWIQELEDAAATIGWNQLQCFVFGKQLLRGAAKLFIRSQASVNNWSKLKNALKEEFKITVSASEVHEKLRNKRKSKDEKMLEFLYSIMEIGKNISLDETSVINYFVEGIPDLKQNKLILYQAANIKSLKEAIKVYEKVRGPVQSSNRVGTQAEASGKSTKQEAAKDSKRCFKCGNSSHLAKDCQKPQVKCFKCNNWGHRSFECQQVAKTPQPNDRNARSQNINMMTNKAGSQLIFKAVSIENHVVDAMVDTGCVVSLMRYDFLMMLDDRIELSGNKIQLVGIGQSGFETMGSIIATVSADGMIFKMQFHVVAARDLTFSVIIGKNILDKVDLVISNESTRFRAKAEAASQAKSIKVDSQKVEAVKAVETARNKPQMPTKYDEWFAETQTLCMTAAKLEFSNDEKLVDVEHLKPKDAEVVEQMVMSYSPNKSKVAPVKMKLIMKDEIPIRQRARCLPYVEQQVVNEQVNEWLKEGIIRPSTSEYASPVVLVKKKYNSYRMGCDYRQINKKIVKDNFPMPLIDEAVERLQGAKVFTTLDLANGFFHFPVEEDSIKYIYTAFVVQNGQYEFLRVPFGITNSPAVFTRYVMAIFRDMIEQGLVVIYMDDIIVPSKDENEGIQKLKAVFARAAEYGLYIKWKKCQMLQRRVNFLGYIIEGGTIKPSKEKTAAIENYPLPLTSKALQRFLGLTSYFRQFVENYAVVAKPLSDLLRKDAEYQLKDEQLAAFEQLKSALMNAPVLQIYDQQAVTEIHADACQFGYGAVLMQKNTEDSQLHPIQYMSRKTKPVEEKYHSYELEVLAIIEALKKWRTYVLGRPVKIVTDCNAFQMTMQKADVPLRVARWAMFLQEYDYTIEHRSGSKMKHVDALSRVACLMMTQTLSERLANAQKADKWVDTVMKLVEKDGYEDYYLKQSVLYKDPNKELIVVPEAMEAEVISIAHRQGHYAAKKTCEIIQKSFHIPQLEQKVAKAVKSCIECIIINEKAGKKEGLVFPLDKEDTPLTTLHLDHVGPMEATKKGYNYLLVVVDGFSKFVWLYPTKNTGADAVIACMKKQAAVFGNPRRVITDRGAAFTSNAFKQYLKDQRVDQVLITTGVPRANGQVERMHRIVVPMLAKLSHSCPSKWYKYVDEVQQTINNTPPRSTKHSPFKILTGVDMRLACVPELQQMLREAAEEQLNDERSKIREEAKQNIQTIQAENKQYANLRRRPAEQYAVGDLVAIKRTQYGTGLRLRPRYFGPYKVTAVQPNDRYEVVRVGDHEGPKCTRTVAEHMKRWR